jgi:6-pyruvoyltetrahydropterin/6-carboxytetrahydropterin synthase
MAKSASKKTAASRSRPVVRPLRGVVYITRQAHFNAAHRLFNPTKDDQWNEEKYGLCSNVNWHGHNYVLEVTIAGEPDPETGYLMDLSTLKKIIEEQILLPCDHRNLPLEVPFLKGIIPTSENLVIAFWERLEPHIQGGRLHAVKLFETPRNFVEFRGPATF